MILESNTQWKDGEKRLQPGNDMTTDSNIHIFVQQPDYHLTFYFASLMALTVKQ